MHGGRGRILSGIFLGMKRIKRGKKRRGVWDLHGTRDRGRLGGNGVDLPMNFISTRKRKGEKKKKGGRNHPDQGKRLRIKDRTSSSQRRVRQRLQRTTDILLRNFHKNRKVGRKGKGSVMRRGRKNGVRPPFLSVCTGRKLKFLKKISRGGKIGKKGSEKSPK